jgi:hypothetical protein
MALRNDAPTGNRRTGTSVSPARPVMMSVDKLLTGAAPLGVLPQNDAINFRALRVSWHS